MKYRQQLVEPRAVLTAELCTRLALPAAAAVLGAAWPDLGAHGHAYLLDRLIAADAHELLATLRRRLTGEEQDQIAGHAAATGNVLDLLVPARRVSTARRVAEHPRSLPATLLRLAGHRDAQVRRSVQSHPALTSTERLAAWRLGPEDPLDAICRDPDTARQVLTCYALGEHPKDGSPHTAPPSAVLAAAPGGQLSPLLTAAVVGALSARWGSHVRDYVQRGPAGATLAAVVEALAARDDADDSWSPLRALVAVVTVPAFAPLSEQPGGARRWVDPVSVDAAFAAGGTARSAALACGALSAALLDAEWTAGDDADRAALALNPALGLARVAELITTLPAADLHRLWGQPLTLEQRGDVLRRSTRLLPDLLLPALESDDPTVRAAAGDWAHEDVLQVLTDDPAELRAYRLRTAAALRRIGSGHAPAVRAQVQVGDLVAAAGVAVEVAELGAALAAALAEPGAAAAFEQLLPDWSGSIAQLTETIAVLAPPTAPRSAA